MKSLAFARPLVLVLVGLPGAGKSFFARQFAEMFGAPMVSYDRLQYELFMNPQHTQQEQDIIHRLAHYQIGELLKTKRSFIIDGGSSSKGERLTLGKMAAKNGYDMLLIWVQTDTNTAKMRSLKRNPSRPDDEFTAQLNADQYALLAKAHHTPGQENHVVISGKHAFSTQAKMVLRRLTSPHAEQAGAAHQKVAVPERQVQAPQRPPTATRRVIIS